MDKVNDSKAPSSRKINLKCQKFVLFFCRILGMWCNFDILVFHVFYWANYPITYDSSLNKQHKAAEKHPHNIPLPNFCKILVHSITILGESFCKEIDLSKQIHDKVKERIIDVSSGQDKNTDSENMIVNFIDDITILFDLMRFHESLLYVLNRSSNC